MIDLKINNPHQKFIDHRLTYDQRQLLTTLAVQEIILENFDRIKTDLQLPQK
jgi:hypothetical protein